MLLILYSINNDFICYIQEVLVTYIVAYRRDGIVYFNYTGLLSYEEEEICCSYDPIMSTQQPQGVMSTYILYV